MKSTIKRMTAWLLAVLMIFQGLPISAFAADVYFYSDPIYAQENYAVTFVNDGKEVLKQFYAKNESPAIEALPETPVKLVTESTDKAFYHFDGWYCGGTKVDIGTPVTGNMTVEAKFSDEQWLTVTIHYVLGTDHSVELSPSVERSYLPWEDADTITSPVVTNEQGTWYPALTDVTIDPAALADDEEYDSDIYVEYAQNAAKYTVHFMQENLRDDFLDVPDAPHTAKYYTEVTSSEYTYPQSAAVGSRIMPDTPTFPGFECEEVDFQEIKASESDNQFYVYYKRNVYCNIANDDNSYSALCF